MTAFSLGFFLCLLAGCATEGPEIDRMLRADKGLATPDANVAGEYAIHCPDVLDINVDTRPDLSGRREIGPDGRIDLGTLGRWRVEGQTVAALTQHLAAEAAVPPAWVRVHVAEYRSQQIYLIGQVAGLQRAVPYQGPETVLDLLHRVGGLTPGAAPDNVSVVRARIVEGQRPEVFRVDLRAILVQHDMRSNLRLQPFDQVFVGETRQCSLEKAIPPWLRPAYEAICGMRRPSREG